jgi:hypothetical protein
MSSAPRTLSVVPHSLFSCQELFENILMQILENYWDGMGLTDEWEWFGGPVMRLKYGVRTISKIRRVCKNCDAFITSSRLLQQGVRMISGHDFGWKNDWNPVIVCASASSGCSLQFRPSIWLAV